MAKVSAHGQIVATLEYITHAQRYMGDGAILKNHGHGWKLAGKVPPGLSPQEAARKSQANLDKQLAEKPAAAAYRTALHNLAGLGKRWKLHMAVQMMPDDPDGVWSECCDGYGDNVHADIDDVAELCRAYLHLMRLARDPIPA